MFLGDERYTIILNTRSVDDYVSTELASLLEYFDSGNVESTDDFITSLDELVSSVAHSRVGERIMTLQDLIDASEKRAAAMMEEAEKMRREGEELRREGEELRREGEELRREGEELRREGEELRREGEKMMKAADEKVRNFEDELKAAEKKGKSIAFELYSEGLITAEKAAEKLGISVEEFIRLYDEHNNV